MYIYIYICKYIYIYIYIGTQKHNNETMKTASAIKQLLETLFLAIKMCAGFTADGLSMNTMCAVSLANHLKALADAFRPFFIHQRY